MPELDAVRGVAVSLVILVHGFSDHAVTQRGVPALFLRLASGGWLGVNLFFVLSGFLITGILLDSRSRPHYYRNFYIRRALRILPAYYALLLLLLVTKGASISFLVLSFVYLANLTPLFGVPMSYGPLWSLAVEEHFYLLWPVLVKRTKSWGLPVTAATLLIMCPLMRAVYFLMHGNPEYIISYTWLTVDGLAIGSLLASMLRSRYGSRQFTTRVAWCMVLASVIVMFAGKRYGILTRNRLLGAMFQVSLFNVLFAGIILLLLLAFSGRFRRFSHVPGLEYLGSISYGLYLIHLEVFRLYDLALAKLFPEVAAASSTFYIMWIRFAVVATISIILAGLSRRYFEGKFLRMKDQLAPPWNRALSEAIPVAQRTAVTVDTA